jgi:hypothetical protein
MSIPENIRMAFLSAKRVDEEKSDWSENMKDETFSNIYKTIKECKKDLAEREYQLRENKRTNK